MERKNDRLPPLQMCDFPQQTQTEPRFSQRRDVCSENTKKQAECRPAREKRVEKRFLRMKAKINTVRHRKRGTPRDVRPPTKPYKKCVSGDSLRRAVACVTEIATEDNSRIRFLDTKFQKMRAYFAERHRVCSNF